MSTAAPPERPRWTVPIVLGAVVTFAMHVIVFFEPRLWIGFACGCTGLPLGLFPAVSAMRRDRSLQPLEGFAVSFVAVGTGMMLTVLLGLGGYRVPPELSRNEMLESWKAWNGRLAPEDRYTPEAIDGYVDLMQQVVQYAPVITAAMATLLAGVVGLLTVALGRWPDRIAERERRGRGR